LLGNVVIMIQFFFAIVIGLYFLNLLKSQQGNRIAVERESGIEMEKLKRLREISLSEPLSEKTRPACFDEIIGQKEGIKALKAALCGPNPQHVLIYGPPGIGKTCAARLVLEEAKRNPQSPFKTAAKFIEMDATSIRFDERSKAHGGVLFLDEIGELHPTQMNKLLKILEDRKVFLESAYYNSQDANIPRHIHEIFQNGLPADFRLVGATTRSPNDISPAIRSRCLEIFFRSLQQDEVMLIGEKAAKKGGFAIDPDAVRLIGKYAGSGREAVNIVQLAGGIALTQGKLDISQKDTEWVVNNGNYCPRNERVAPDAPRVGFVNGLAVYGPFLGDLIEVEATAMPAARGKGILTITGIIEEEEIGREGRRLRCRGTAKGSVDNVLTVVRKYLNLSTKDYDLHFNFPGGVPVDGPSAGVSMAVAVYSAITGLPVDNKVAMTGEISIHGRLKLVGGITAKLEAAKRAGLEKVIIPKDNWQVQFQGQSIEIIAADRIEEVIEHAIIRNSL